MKCDVCEKEATVFLTQIINGQMTTVNLCEECSKAKGVTEETGFGLAEAFLTPSHRSEESMEVVCNACGFTASQLKKIGRMGCPECYTAFREGLDGLLRNMHKGTRHVGKRPGKSAAAPQLLPRQRASVVREEPPPVPAAPPATPPVDMNKLRAALDLAVKEERYEDAAKLKAEIERLQPKTPSK
ncbi:UvrB/UvrC motif-containing protein [Prosthecobacter sp.]|jgi:protein arginine kinase activator|uniref:UvrB/UvrC motif-containing protein n=1 Tax=Prosthecobacter sp. TaxID=1965333 RepID=UPI00378361DF